MLLQTQPTCHEKPSVPDRSGARCVAAVLHPGRPGRGKPADRHGQHPDARHRESRIERHGDRAPRECLLPAQKLDRHFVGQLSANPRPEIHAHRGRRHNARLAVLDAEVGPRVVRAAVPAPAPRYEVVRLHRVGLRRLFQDLRRGPDGQNGVSRISRRPAQRAAQGSEGRSGSRPDPRRRRNDRQHPPARIPRRDVPGNFTLCEFIAQRTKKL